MSEAVTPSAPLEINSQPSGAPQAGATPVTEPQAVTSPTGDNNAAVETPSERLVSERKYNSVQEQNRRLRQQLAETQRNRGQNAVTVNPVNQDGSVNPEYVANLELKTAELELKDGARKLLKSYPDLDKAVKRAILRNPRGFVRQDTQDVQTGLMDIEDYLAELSDAGAVTTSVPPVKKQVPVAGTNIPAATQGGTNDAEVAAILAKPVTEWTEADRAKLDMAGAPKL